MKRNEIVLKDCIEGMKELPDNSINMVITSPPYSDVVSYGNDVRVMNSDDYVDWFTKIGHEIKRILKPDGSFIMNIGNKAENRERALYVMKTVIALREQCKLAFHDEYIWHKPCSIPNGSAKRLDCVFEFIFHFTKSAGAHKCNMDSVREPYAKGTLNRDGKIEVGYNKKVSTDGTSEIPVVERKVNPLGKIPNTVFHFQTASGVKNRTYIHPAAFHKDLPSWFIKWLTDPGDLVLDPFMGSGTTAIAAWELGRDYLGFEINQIYLDDANEIMKAKNLISF